MYGYRKTYTVWVLPRSQDKWVRIPREYHAEGMARAVYTSASHHPDSLDTMLSVEETSVYSDLKTRKEMTHTLITAID